MPLLSPFSKVLEAVRLDAKRLSGWHVAPAVLLLAACGGGPDVTVKPGDDGTGGTGGSTATGGTGTGGRPIVDPGEGGEAGGGEEPDPCAAADPPPECFEIGPSGPACGDGELNQSSEICDDGNSLPGDGCSGVCTVEPYWECPRPGRRCRMTIACGDGSKDPGEVCDDGNSDDDDGCSADCLTQDPSYVCTTPGEPCILLFRCGDSRVNGSETCDDGDDDAGDGCSDRCRLEDGYACARPGHACTRIYVCGDGRREGTEQCDDGGVMPDDGCSAQCRTEADWVCMGATGAQSACTNLVVCGDGIVNGNEACDDDNTTDGDGCAANCRMVETGYACARAGHACRPVCGDGLKRGDEQCDDDNTADGDGCSSGCRPEDDTVCTGEGASSCRPTVCGSNGREGNEACDDGNDVPFDGCFQCRREPTCTNGACVSVCGDGQRYSNEGCDDGNTTPGDGCSATCRVEPGYTCSDNTSTPPGTRDQPVVYRDFIGVGRTAGGSTAHTDFNQLGGSGVIGMTEAALNSAGKPVYACPGGVCDNNPGRLYRGNNGGDRQANLSTAANFAQWYTDVPGVNVTSYGSVLLTRNTTTGNYVFDSGAGSYFDPIGTGGWVALGKETRTCSPARNVSFTSETRFWFEYSGGEFFEFAGDDDTWVFVAGQLAVDLGGLHTPRTGDFTLDSDTDGAGADTADGTAVARMFNMPALPYTTATPPGAYQTGSNFSRTLNLGLVPGQVYEVAMFQAERNECGSNFKITLKNFDNPKSTCTPVCGDEIITPGEECDDGNSTTSPPNNTSTPVYGGCTAGTCSLGPYCGDHDRNQPEEACDDGVNRSQWGQSGCAPGCTLPPSCGDGQIDAAFEECDLGAGNTASGYGGCTTSCTIGPSCGDGTVQNPPETCDDGVNDGFYGSCTPECAPGPRCGDGDPQEEWGEECDSSDPGCINCRLGAQCGDRVVQSGEDCDDGVNDGGYGECGPRCKYGPRCGDGVANGDEDCDDGDGNNTGGYGRCAPGCVYGPYCGDDRVQSAFEQCDDGNNRNGDGCSSACKNEQSIPH